MADIEEKLRIERLVADTNLVMQMCSIHTSCAAHFADNSPRHHIGTFANGDFCEMRVSGGNAIGVYDYREKRRVLVNQQGYKVETNNKLKPKTEYVLVKENQKVAKITADVFKCRKST